MTICEFYVLPGAKLIGMTFDEVEKKYNVKILEVDGVKYRDDGLK